ncbi:MAG: hypothetical protein U1B80_04045, partial [Anaerolineaceae bacterium]|nr:hypothetical protein [Anaerolineaceae bacterium]
WQITVCVRDAPFRVVTVGFDRLNHRGCHGLPVDGVASAVGIANPPTCPVDALLSAQRLLLKAFLLFSNR